jgi:hypothetical protein
VRWNRSPQSRWQSGDRGGATQVWATTSQRATFGPPIVNMLQLMFPEGERNGPLAADCTTTVGVGGGGGVTVTVTVGVESCVAIGIGADVDVEGAGVPDGAWTAVEPADVEQPARVTAASAARHARPRHPVAGVACCRSCGFSVMP